MPDEQDFTASWHPQEQVPDCAILMVEGQVRYGSARRLRDLIWQEFGDGDHGCLVVDLAAVEKLDTAGVAVLAEAILEAPSHEKTLLLCEPSDSVRRIFKLAGMDEILQACFSNPEEVMSEISARPGTR